MVRYRGATVLQPHARTCSPFFGGLLFAILQMGLQIPLFGIMSSDSSDPLYWIRVILASNRGGF